MTEHYSIALNVGRTFIRSALVDDRGHILPDSFSIFSSKSSDSEELVLKNLVKIIKFNINSVLQPNFEIHHIGFSLPDYLMTNQQENWINERKLNSLLQKEASVKSKLSQNYTFYFERESYLFALGEHILRKEEYRNQKVIYLVLGTEMSVTLFDKGNRVFEIVQEQNKILKKHLSARGIIKIAQTLEINEHDLTPKRIAEMAVAKNKQAIETYYQFGKYLGNYLINILAMYSANEIVIGGNIALSYPLFESGLKSQFDREMMLIYPTEHTSYYVFFGLAEYIKQLNDK